MKLYLIAPRNPESYVRDTSRYLEALIGELHESETVGPSAQVAGRTR